MVQFRASRHIMCPNLTSVWKVMTIWISRELSLFNVEHLNILCTRIRHPCEKLRPFEFLEWFRYLISSVPIYYKPKSNLGVKSYDHFNFSKASVVHFLASLYIMRLNLTSVWKVMTILNFSRDSVVQFRASRYIMRLNLTSELKVMTIWISRELPLFNFERLDILSTWIWHPS